MIAWVSLSRGAGPSSTELSRRPPDIEKEPSDPPDSSVHSGMAQNASRRPAPEAIMCLQAAVSGQAGKVFRFPRAEINVGRRRENDLVLAHASVADWHARILSRDGRFIIVDLKSTSGTWSTGGRSLRRRSCARRTSSGSAA